MNNYDKRSTIVANKIIATIGCASLAYIYNALYPNYILNRFLRDQSASDMLFTVTGVILGCILALLLLANTVGAYSKTFREAVARFESRDISIPVVEVIFLFIEYMFMMVEMLFLTFVDLFRVSVLVIFIYPVLFILVFIHMGFTMAAKFKLIDRLNAMSKMANNPGNFYMNPMEYREGGYGYPQQGAYPQYPNHPWQQYPQYQNYPQQQTPQYPPQNNARSDNAMPQGMYSDNTPAHQSSPDCNLPNDKGQDGQ